MNSASVTTFPVIGIWVCCAQDRITETVSVVNANVENSGRAVRAIVAPLTTPVFHPTEATSARAMETAFVVNVNVTLLKREGTVENTVKNAL